MSDYEQVPLEDIVIRGTITFPAKELQGLAALEHWLRGFEAGGNGRVPGHFELTMHLRAIAAVSEVKTSHGNPTPPVGPRVGEEG